MGLRSCGAAEHWKQRPIACADDWRCSIQYPTEHDFTILLPFYFGQLDAERSEKYIDPVKLSDGLNLNVGHIGNRFPFMEDGVIRGSRRLGRLTREGYLPHLTLRIPASKGYPDKVANSQHAARSVSGEPSETGDYAIFSVDDPARLSKG